MLRDQRCLEKLGRAIIFGRLGRVSLTEHQLVHSSHPVSLPHLGLSGCPNRYPSMQKLQEVEEEPDEARKGGGKWLFGAVV